MLYLQREPSTPHFTRGELRWGDKLLCYTLEDVVREVAGQPVSAWKVKGSTAIPKGKYRVTLEPSVRFGADTLTIHGVEGFSSIRMHGGNTEADTEGCPLLGLETTPTGVRNCAGAVALVKDTVRNSPGGETWILIDDAGELS